jgi:hypothetical protein
MIGAGSQQLRLFRRAIRDGATLDEACAATGNIIGREEGKIYLAADAKNPPPEEAYELLYDPDAKAAASDEKDVPMATRAKKDDEVEEVKVMDFDRAAKLYRGDIKSAKSEAASQNQTVGEAYKAIKKECHIQPQSAKAAIKAYEMEEARRDDHLRGFCGMLNELAGFTLVTFHGRDLVDQAEGESDRPQMRLVGIDDEGDDPSVNDEADDFTEATDEELAAQKPRAEDAEAKAVRKASVTKMKPVEPVASETVN